MSEIVFYHNPMSRGRIVHWMLEEAGVPYKSVVIDFETKEHKGADYLAINPMGKVPAIVHDGAVVTETAAILAYVAELVPEKKLAPAIGDAQRGSYLRWLFFGAGCVEPAIVDKMLARPAVERKGALGYGSYEDVIATLDKALEKGPYLLGEQFTAADVYIASALGWGAMMKALSPTQNLQAYLGRATERPAYQRALGTNAAKT